MVFHRFDHFQEGRFAAVPDGIALLRTLFLLAQFSSRLCSRWQLDKPDLSKTFRLKHGRSYASPHALSECLPLRGQRGTRNPFVSTLTVHTACDRWHGNTDEGVWEGKAMPADVRPTLPGLCGILATAAELTLTSQTSPSYVSLCSSISVLPFSRSASA
jgi:hypothetical protein